MTTITKRVEITDPNRLHLDLDLELPEDLPVGPAEVSLTINPIRLRNKKRFAGLFGIFKGKNVYDGTGVELQRKWRGEWPE
jgi:hypothetical protein